jgi:transmembrane sensor
MKEPMSWQLLAKYFAGETSSEENLLVSNWLAADKANQALFRQAKNAWQEAQDKETGFNLHRGLSILSGGIHKKPHQPSVTPYLHKAGASKTYPLLRIAAVIAVTVGFSILVSLLLPGTGMQPGITFLEKVNTTGQRSVITLSDGSKIYLNADSKIKYPEKFSAAGREVFLSGEAFFEVAKDANRPFTVNTGALSTRVLGTSFNVNAYGQASKIVVTVATGRVQISRTDTITAGSQTVTLAPHELAEFNPVSKQIQKRKARLDQVTAWKEGVLYFEDTPLHEVAEALKRWYGVAVVFKNPSIRNCLLTARFQNETVHTILETISISTQIKYSLKGKQIIFSGDGC